MKKLTFLILLILQVNFSNAQYEFSEITNFTFDGGFGPASSIVKHNNHIYVARGFDNSQISYLLTFNISDPNNITRTDFKTYPNSSKKVMSLYIENNKLFAIGSGFFTFSLDNPNVPEEVAYFSEGTGGSGSSDNALSGINLVVKNNTLLLASSLYIKTFNISSNTPVFQHRRNYTGIMRQASLLNNNTALFSDGYSLMKIDFTNPSNFTKTDLNLATLTGGSVSGFEINFNSNKALVTYSANSGSDKIHVVNLNSFTLENTYDYVQAGNIKYLNNNILFAPKSNGFYLVDATNDNGFNTLADFNTPYSGGGSRALSFDGGFVISNRDHIIFYKWGSDAPSSIDFDNVANEFIYFPNPAQKLVHFENLDFQTQICLYNQLGKLVKKQNGSLTSMDVSDIAKGVYFLCLTSNEKVNSYKLIVN